MIALIRSVQVSCFNYKANCASFQVACPTITGRVQGGTTVYADKISPFCVRFMSESRRQHPPDSEMLNTSTGFWIRSSDHVRTRAAHHPAHALNRVLPAAACLKTGCTTLIPFCLISRSLSLPLFPQPKRSPPFSNAYRCPGTRVHCRPGTIKTPRTKSGRCVFTLVMPADRCL